MTVVGSDLTAADLIALLFGAGDHFLDIIACQSSPFNTFGTQCLDQAVNRNSTFIVQFKLIQPRLMAKCMGYCTAENN
jgi:hypothetical protein